MIVNVHRFWLLILLESSKDYYASWPWLKSLVLDSDHFDHIHEIARFDLFSPLLLFLYPSVVDRFLIVVKHDLLLTLLAEHLLVQISLPLKDTPDDVAQLLAERIPGEKLYDDHPEKVDDLIHVSRFVNGQLFEHQVRDFAKDNVVELIFQIRFG